MKRTVKMSSVLLIFTLLLTSCISVEKPKEIEPAAVVEAEVEAQTEAGGSKSEEEQIVPEVDLIELDNALTRVYEEVSPSVVNIQVVKRVSTSFIIPQFPGFSIPEQEDKGSLQSSLGSGFVWDKAGHIITNNHVVENAEQIRVTFSDGVSYEAELVGTNPDSDLAVIKVDVSENRLLPVTLGDSTQVKVGNLVIAIGNPFGLQGTMTFGVVSALGRSLDLPGSSATGGSNYTIPDVIQTDAPINPGNSGGVLVNIRGEVIGVTTAIESPVEANAGIGFVVPSVIVKNIIPSLIDEGEYDYPWIGVSGFTLSSTVAEAIGLPTDQHGVLVVEVIADSPADQAGVKGSDREIEIQGTIINAGGDVIVSINDQPVNDFEDLVAFLVRSTTVGDTVKLGVIREGENLTLDLTLGSRPKAEETPEPEMVEQPVDGGAWLGISGRNLVSEIAEAMDLDSDQKGVLVERITKGSPADNAGLNGSYKSFMLDNEKVMIGGDVIIAIANEPVETLIDLQQILRDYTSGDTVEISVLRNGEQEVFEVELGTQPQ
jgi:S1-C subfamily serine protease